MNLTQEPELVQWPETHYVFVEKIGPFSQTAPQAWQELLSHFPAILKKNTITKRFSLYNVNAKTYRAGVALSAPPVDLPAPLAYELFSGGKYSRLTYTGPYTGLPAASGRAWEIAAEKQIPLRDGFAIENYVNDPQTTPQDQLITEILFPSK